MGRVPAVDLPRAAGDTHVSLRLSSFGRPLKTRNAGPVGAMNHSEFQLRALGDPRLAPHAASALPAWLWSTDGTQILWANPAGARLFGATNSTALAEKNFGPADQHRRQVAQLANRLPADGALRLGRLGGFGGGVGVVGTRAV